MATRCRACGNTIGWYLTENNKRMPLDPNTHPDGNVILDRTDPMAPPVAVVLGGAELEAVRERGDVPTFMPHWATCPHADAIRPDRPPGPRQRKALEDEAGVTRLADARRRRQTPTLFD